MVTDTLASPTVSVNGTADDGLFEILDGARADKFMGARELCLANRLALEMWNSLGADPTGEVFVEMLFRLKPGSKRARRPDVAFVPYVLWPDRDVPEDEAWEVVPPLAVEIVSRTNTAETVLAKIQEYFESGVQLVWVCYSKQRVVHVYKDAKTIQVLSVSDFLECPEVLPGFKISVGDLLPPVKVR